MKSSIYLFTGIFILLFSPTTFAGTLMLHEALKSKKVNCVIHGNNASTHYLEPIVLEVSNTSNEVLSIAIENGDMFIPADSNKQNIVVTSTELLVLQPKTKKTINIKGMCTEHSDGSGNESTIYSFAPVTNEKLKKLSAFISEKKYQSSAAQYAVWSLMDNNDINSIYSSDSTEENDLKKFMASLTGKTFVVRSKDYRYNYYEPPKEKVGGMFEYSFTQAQDIQIAMFDKNGILVRELFNQKKVPAGTHKLNFEYDSSVYTEDVYYFKLIVGSEVMVNRKWDASAMRDAFKKKIENRE
jgi:hypothetical protein